MNSGKSVAHCFFIALRTDCIDVVTNSIFVVAC
jgi:hypothetical protein